MIEIKNLIKKYGERLIIDNLTLSFPNKGIVSLVGASGSGKTTILNMIGGVDLDFNGSININNTFIQKLNHKELCEFRLHNIGYVFQSFNLLNLDSVEDNIKIALDASNNSANHVKNKRIDDLLNILGIKKLKKKVVNKLSGGEKQRVAIARAIINKPQIILCDEPTGALDESNSSQIAEILKKISCNSLVIIATHDLALAKNISDQIIELVDGKIIKTSVIKQAESNSLKIIDCKKETKTSSLSISFKIRHSIQKIKNKKFRSLISNGMLSLSLAGVGISLVITNNVSQKITSAFENLTNGNQIVMTLRHDNGNAVGGVYSAPYEKVEEISNKYNYFFNGIGASYLVNFENFFIDENDFYTNIRGLNYHLSSYSTRLINDFKWLRENNRHVVFPYSIDFLNDDEVVLGLTYTDMINWCFQLQIQRSYKVLGDYIRQNPTNIILKTENKNWVYDDEQIFAVKGIIETDSPCFYHTNNLWNEIVFEQMMRLPSIDGEGQKFPWEMYKIYYFDTKEDPSVFLDKAMYDDELFDFVFERTNYNFNSSFCKPNEPCEEKRIFVYYADKNSINLSHINYLKSIYPAINDYFLTSDFGYSCFASAIINGFSKNLFVSTSKEDIDIAIDADTSINENVNISLNLPDGVIMGNYLNGLDNGLKFSSHPKSYLYGRPPNNLNEIAISKGLGKKLLTENLGLGNYLYIAGENEETFVNNKIIKSYCTTKVVVTGIVDEENNYLYHSPNWSVSFFRDKLAVSSFSLIPKGIVFELDQKEDSSKLIDKLNKTYHDYIFTSPIDEITKSLSSTLEYANAILVGFSILSSLISILLLGSTLLINILESKNEIRLLNYIGINKKDIQSVFVVQSVIQGLLAFLVSAFEIIIVDLFISLALKDMIGGTLNLSINFIPIIVVFLLSISISLLTSYFMSKLLLKKEL